ncbi:hypothetical protein DXB67_20485 [Bacteroides caccae]|nr:hypothetical protein DXB67_20485 [Bacteroides caccae]
MVLIIPKQKIMSNYLYTSNLQKRYDKGKLISISEVKYTFQNIPLDGTKLHKGVVNFVIDNYVSFDMFFQKEENGYYFYEDRSEVFIVQIRFNEINQTIENIIIQKRDVDLVIDFIQEKMQNLNKDLIVKNILSSTELRNVHPERLYSEEKLNELIETYEDRVDTASDWADDYDTDSYTRSVMRSKLYEYNRYLSILKAERDRRHK